MNCKLLFSFLLIITISANLKAESFPKNKTFWLTTNFGIGTHSSKITTEEEQFVNIFNIHFVSQSDSSTKPFEYHYYTDYFNLALNYQLTTQYSVGLNYQYRSVNQRIKDDYYEEYGSPEGILYLNNIGPIISRWFHIKKLKFSISTSPKVIFGELNRVSYLKNNLTNFIGQDKEFVTLIKNYNKAIDVSGYGLALEINYFLFRKSYLFACVGFGVDASKIYINDENFNYIENTNINNIYFNFSLGFSKF